jgi:hypothetical protein
LRVAALGGFQRDSGPTAGEAEAEQWEPGSAAHLPHDPLGSRVDALGAAVS